MSPSKKIKDYLIVLAALYFGSIGLKSILYIILQDEEHVLMSAVDVVRFNTEIGAILFYMRNISLRVNDSIQVKKALALMFFWPILISKLNK